MVRRSRWGRGVGLVAGGLSCTAALAGCWNELYLVASRQHIVDHDDASASSDAGGDATLGDAALGDAATGDAQEESCDAGLTFCMDAGCVALDTTSHCGACGTACGSPPSGGTISCALLPDAAFACVAACDAGEHACGPACLPNSDSPATKDDSCVIADEYGIFVSSVGGSDGNPGTMAAPLKTITTAILKATSSDGGIGRVYVCNSGMYGENVAVGPASDGISIFGGFSCLGGSWTYSTTSPAVVAPDAGVPLTVTSLVRGAWLSDIQFIAADGPPDSGASAVSAFINTGPAPVTFTRVALRAGRGGSGVAGGTNGSNYGSPFALAGTNADGRTGGDWTTCTCLDAVLSQSGRGGAGGNGSSSDPSAGGTGTPLPVVDAGTGQGGVFGPFCQAGGVGASGASGAAGVAVPLVSAISSSGFATTGGTGNPGSPGVMGQGGGGGSGGLASSSDAGGGSGGGCGGCGGEFGTGGGAGGSSVALAVYQSTNVTLDDCTLTASGGGSGGVGGTGQAGQGGGTFGSSSPPGCTGGTGGNGGAGGSGAGGAGGDSYGVVYAALGDAGAPFMSPGTTIVIGDGGAGGAGGDGGAPGNAGRGATVVSM